MLKETSAILTGNDQYEGFGIDVIKELSKRLGFNYIFKIQQDGAYGNLNKETGEFNGMLKEIIEDVSIFFTSKLIFFKLWCDIYVNIFTHLPIYLPS